MELTSRLIRSGLGLALLLGCGPGEVDPGRSRQERSGTPSPGPDSALPRARATIVGEPGSGIHGEVRLTQLAGNFPAPTVRVEARITGPAGAFAPGRHGFHIHETAKGGCVAPYTSAGGHFDPGPARNSDPDLNHPFHMGDLPNLEVDATGTGTLDATSSRITLSPGPLSILDEDGSVFIVHEKPDQGGPGPAKSGVSGGPRVACGVIEEDSSTAR